MAHLIKEQVKIRVDDADLPGHLTLPSHPIGLVIFAHGSGSSRFSPRNVKVADDLVERDCGTLLFDLLTESEAANRRYVFDIPLLGRRMLHAARFARRLTTLADMDFGFFGASTGAAAALVAAAEPDEKVKAVVSRGGRPDLAGEALPVVNAPTLLIVGALDHVVLDLNRQAMAKMTCETRLDVVPGATHLFEEPGKLEEVSRLAGEWFVGHFRH